MMTTIYEVDGENSSPEFPRKHTLYLRRWIGRAYKSIDSAIAYAGYREITVMSVSVGSISKTPLIMAPN